MDVSLKIKENIFNSILLNDRKSIKHGFSKNKKYTRLFNNKIDKITLISDETKKEIIVNFKSIEIIEINKKLFIQITFI